MSREKNGKDKTRYRKCGSEKWECGSHKKTVIRDS